MRLLHTSDWHVGKTLRGRPRGDEHEAVIQEILQIAVREKVDCLLLSGDIFDSYAPSPEAERLVYSFLAELLGRGIAATVIAGNHDHPKRLEALRLLLDPLRVYVRSEPAPPDKGGVVNLKVNGEEARIAVLPFVPERKVVDACLMMAPEENWYAAYAERVAQMCQKLAESFSPKTINILMAHLYVHGAVASGSEREVHISQPYAISSQRFPGTVHYIALGHLHRPQEVPSPSPCYYAGSPFQLDFGEQGQEKRVVIVDAQAGTPARVESIRLRSGRRLRDIRGTLEALTANAKDFGTDFLRVTVETAGPVPGIADRVRELLPNALDVKTEYPREEAATTHERKQLPPNLLFREFYLIQHGAPPPPRILRAFDDLYEEVTNATE
jgi:exonuclease SbcD